MQSILSELFFCRKGCHYITMLHKTLYYFWISPLSTKYWSPSQNLAHKAKITATTKMFHGWAFKKKSWCNAQWLFTFHKFKRQISIFLILSVLTLFHPDKSLLLKDVQKLKVFTYSILKKQLYVFSFISTQ